MILQQNDEWSRAFAAEQIPYWEGRVRLWKRMFPLNFFPCFFFVAIWLLPNVPIWVAGALGIFGSVGTVALILSWREGYHFAKSVLDEHRATASRRGGDTD